MPRQPILSVLGHVNAGKTSFLDAIRESRITEGEAGQITQMIGATEVPLETLEDVCGGLLNQLDTEIEIPGIMFIDTPGHAAFSSLRKRGGSISDIGILMIDIQEGIQPQTEEAIDILKNSGTPFIVALNKVDTVNGWNTDSDLFTEGMREQQDHVQQQVDQRIYEIMGELNDHGIVSDRFDRVDNFQEKVAIVPISAETHVGIPELLMVVTGLSQNYLSDELDIHEGIGKGTVLEVSKEKGMGTTADVILYDGIMESDDTVVYGTSDGVKETEIRALLEPRPLTEIREDKHYSETDKVEPAAGVKISAKDFEGIISGAPIRTASEGKIEEAREEVEDELESLSYETSTHGIVVKADSLGSLEALMTEIEDKDIQVQKAEVGPVNKSDIVKAEDEESEHRAIFAFNVGVTDQAQEALEKDKVKVFQSKVIYEILDGYTEWKQDLKEKERKEKLESVSRPARIRLMPDHVFRSSTPAVVGCEIVNGVLTSGSKLMTPEGDVIGSVKSIQEQNESIDQASKGDEVAVSISGATVGRNVDEGDILVTDINSDDYRVLQELEDLLSSGEKSVLDEIVEVKDRKNPHWKLG
ncbi:translation initiation factor IF-2 [Candidatus Nanosalina sp. VS9-1]|uniref:translation initiation factor IF-2 n=1 Tax=Candidatus Nanosalina sp. VS9-1 TaxID=3388566 RepID=UPI0039E0D2BC